ncbi:MAG: putative ABC transporter ATP-binding protein [Fimbriimonadaceae bacterium]|nr:putative ABC transporter ATP-binding protein [Fimbriimonadaceae bacterium]
MARLRIPLDPRISSELYKHRAIIVKGLVASGFAAGLMAATIPFIKLILDSVEQRHFERLWWLSLGVIALFSVKYSFTRAQAFYLGKAAARLTSDLRIRMYEKLMRLPLGYFHEKKAGALQSVLTNDVGVYNSAISVVRDSIDGPIKAISGLVSIFILHWQLALICCAVLPVMAVVIQRNGRKIKAAQHDVQVDLANLNAMTQESLQGVRIVKAFGAEAMMKSRFERLVEASFLSQIVAIRRTATLRPLVELIGAVALALVVFVCGYFVQNGTLRVSDLAAFIMGLDVINQGFKNIGSLVSTSKQVEAAADRIYSEILDVPEPMADKPGAKELSESMGRIEFDHVSFAYPDGTLALKDVSFIIEAGHSLALVGPSGAGKSTIADLLQRYFDPSEGRITYDGVDIRDLKTEWLRRQIGVVPQQTFLFAGTIADNIRMGLPEATDGEISEAAIAAHAEPFVATMPNRYETELGERGVRLSGGEMQRVAIARAAVRKPRVLILDEATSNLDAVSEKHVQEALEEIMEERTTLVIAHRLTTAARATKILVLRHGEVVEYGNHSDLMERSGAYAAMYRAFSSGVIDA